MGPPTDLVHKPLYGPVHRPPLYGSPVKTIIKMPIRDLAYRLFFCYCCLLCCGVERRTFVLRKRPITQLTCVFAASLQLPPPFCLVQCSSCSVTRPRLQKYNTVSPFFSLMQPWMARDSKSLENTFLQFINLVQHCRRNTFESLVCHIFVQHGIACPT